MEDEKVKRVLLDEEEEEEFEKQWSMRGDKFKGIIALKGLPYTGKTLVAVRLGMWLKCPVLCVEDLFRDGDGMDQQEAAFTTLCNVAKFNLTWGAYIKSTGVVIKSRLDSSFELKRLLELASTEYLSGSVTYPLLVIECWIRNEYSLKKLFDDVYSKKQIGVSWYRPRSWKDFENVRDDHYINPLLSCVRTLVVDTFDDILNSSYTSSHGLPDDFVLAIKYLLTAPHQELNTAFPNPFRIEFSKLRPFLFDKRITAYMALKGRSEYLCPRGDCDFKLLVEARGSCGVCGKQVNMQEAYACYRCVLVLHKPCAERINFKALRFTLVSLRSYDYHQLLREKHACKSCTDAGKDFSTECGACLYQTHLKCGPLPTIIRHECHQHFLSLFLTSAYFNCNACGYYECGLSYCCKKCGLYYHLQCVFLPLQVMKHEHGGYQHPMKLMYSHDNMNKEEAYWCDHCYKDMNPQIWFYSCQKCPDFAAHITCTTDTFPSFHNLEDAKFVQQVQSQWEDAMAEKEKDDSESHTKA